MKDRRYGDRGGDKWGESSSRRADPWRWRKRGLKALGAATMSSVTRSDVTMCLGRKLGPRRGPARSASETSRLPRGLGPASGGEKERRGRRRSGTADSRPRSDCDDRRPGSLRRFAGPAWSVGDGVRADLGR